MGACSNPKWLDVRECIEAEEAPGLVIVIDARPKPRHRCILYIGRTSPEEVPTYQSWMFQMLNPLQACPRYTGSAITLYILKSLIL